MDIISYYMMIDYLNCLLKAATSLRVSSSQQRQDAGNFGVSLNTSYYNSPIVMRPMVEPHNRMKVAENAPV